jgi:hypothetical protein
MSAEELCVRNQGFANKRMQSMVQNKLFQKREKITLVGHLNDTVVYFYIKIIRKYCIQASIKILT